MLLFENERGKIVVDDSVIAQIVANAANECFGVAGMAAKNFSVSLSVTTRIAE